MISKKGINEWVLGIGVFIFVAIYLMHYFHDRFLLTQYWWGHLSAMVGNPIPMLGTGFLGVATLILLILGIITVIAGLRG